MCGIKPLAYSEEHLRNSLTKFTEVFIKKFVKKKKSLWISMPLSHEILWKKYPTSGKLCLSRTGVSIAWMLMTVLACDSLFVLGT